MPKPAATTNSQPAEKPKRNRRESYPPVPPPTLTIDMISHYFVHVDVRTIWRWISSEKFPKPDVSRDDEGLRLRLWFTPTIEKWLADQAGKAA